MPSSDIKHIFLVSSTDHFSSLFIDALIEKAGINHETLGVAVFGGVMLNLNTLKKLMASLTFLTRR